MTKILRFIKKISKLVFFVLLGFFMGYFAFSNFEDKLQLQKTATKPFPNNEIICPYKLDSSYPTDSYPTYTNEIVVRYPPIAIPPDHNLKPYKEKFNPNPDTFLDGKALYRNSIDESPWFVDHFDVDNDGKDEQIYYGRIAMNHGFHIALIVKNGNIIFDYRGNNLNLESDVPAGNGFTLSENINWLDKGENKITRYIYKDGMFVPIWYQTECWVIPSN